jgi:hypothetical protein
MKDCRIQSSVHNIVKSREGNYRQEHLFVLKQAVDLYDYYHQQIEACDRQLEVCLSQFTPGAVICAIPHILWQYSLDIQEWLPYTHFQ